MLLARWNRLITRPRFAADAVAASAEMPTIARIATAAPLPIRAAIRLSTFHATQPSSELPMSRTIAMTLSRRWPTLSARNPAGMSTTSRARP
jgi:hypothetical protein